ncbi:gp53-like domain-containing protein [Phascolarctobacterium succinatutens]|uniref:gp53-like domain-containing protein n=1 Tax=Phascolarctobacterium succinatutens TaxID=626940 RepID=UPI003C6EA34A
MFFPFYALCWAVLDLQWGLSDNMQSQTITFPISFPKSCYHVTWMAISTVTNAYKASGYVNSVTRNSFYVTADNINCQKYWLAIGV